MKPTTPLPWKQADGHFQHVTGDDLAYIIHAANAYPELIKALWECRNASDSTDIHVMIDALFVKLGEL